MSYPQVEFSVLNLDACIKSVSQFFDDDCLPFGRFQNFIASHFSFDLSMLQSLPQSKRREQIALHLTPLYNEKLELMEKAKNEVESLFNESKEQIFSTLNSIFNVELSSKISAGVMFNPTCPRYLKSLSFEIYYGADSKYNLNTCIHEIIHFYFFEKWKRVFTNYDESTFESPHLVWLFSELSIDAIFKCTKLKDFLYNDTPAYDYFYSESIGGVSIMQTFKNLFLNNSIENYFKKGMDFIYENKAFFKKLTN